MKKIVIHFPGKILLPLAAFGLFITGCTSNDTSSTTASGTDTAMTVKTDTMMTDQTHVAMVDTTKAMINSDSLARVSRDTMLKLNVNKSKKKVKISIAAPAKRPMTTTMEADKEGIYENTEILPAFPGGQKALERYFEKNIVYPDAATENNTEGTVNLTFLVDESGKVYNPVPMGATIGYGIEAEAIRVFKNMPNWTPGKIKGKNVKTRYTLPIKFQLY
ncbi:MAG: energy transducer TonB [Ferruginibacter sp.]